MDEPRATFKFFRSFYEAALEIRDPAEQAAFFRAVCAYALNGEEEQTTGIPAAMFRLVKPVIDKSFVNAQKGRAGGLKRQEQLQSASGTALSTASGTALSTASGTALSDARKKEEGRKEEGSMEEGREKEKREAFSLFWEVYPRKVGKEEAFCAFLDCGVEINTLLQAVLRHKESEEWQRQAGRFIPNPANYLRARRFEDELAAGEPKPAQGQTSARAGRGGCDEATRQYLAALHERRRS